MRFKVVMALTVKNTVYWYVMPHSLVGPDVSEEPWYLSAKLQDGISKKTIKLSMTRWQ
jgi:hypothetical protein